MAESGCPAAGLMGSYAAERAVARDAERGTKRDAACGAGRGFDIGRLPRTIELVDEDGAPWGGAPTCDVADSAVDTGVGRKGTAAMGAEPRRGGDEGKDGTPQTGAKPCGVTDADVESEETGAAPRSAARPFALRYIDERLLPGELAFSQASDWRAVVDAVKTLAVRGAPAIGIAGAGAVALAAQEALGGRVAASEADVPCGKAVPVGGARRSPCDFADASCGEGDCPADEGSAGPENAPRETDAAGASSVARTGADILAHLEACAPAIANARPTAVNLSWAVERALECARGASAAGVCAALGSLVVEMEREDERANRAIGEHGAALLPEVPGGVRILTHCNAGSLATAFYGTALGVVYAAAEQGRVARVYADETRPVGQGARLTVWELARAGVPTTLICDNMAASLMAAGKIDAVVVGADRICANGDTANKIGTYGVAVLARAHGIPFFVAAPTSTVDLSLAHGSQIPIEERAAAEVLPEPIEGVEVFNPAFDVTPAEFITAIVTENGAFAPARIAEALRG